MSRGRRRFLFARGGAALCVFSFCASAPPGVLLADEAASGTLSIITDPPALVTVDGRVLGMAPFARRPLQAGRHQLVLELSQIDGERRLFEYRLLIEEGRETLASLNLRQAPPATGDAPCLSPATPESAELRSNSAPGAAALPPQRGSSQVRGEAPPRRLYVHAAPDGARVWREGEAEPSASPAVLEIGSSAQYITVRSRGHARAYVAVPAGSEDIEVRVRLERPRREVGISLVVLGTMLTPLGIASAVFEMAPEATRYFVTGLSAFITGVILWVLGRRREPTAELRAASAPAEGELCR